MQKLGQETRPVVPAGSPDVVIKAEGYPRIN